MAPIPVTVLTGYLGAGKTTLLNHILTGTHGQKYAVIVNEFGELGIDNDLVLDAEEEVFEMNNGCICCTVRGDLIRIIGGLMKRAGKLDGIIVETTGLADPAPVAQTFFVDEEVRERTRLDAIVTVVDALHFLDRVEDSPEAEEQVAFADVILLNKTDLVDQGQLKAVEARLRAINPYAKLHPTVRSELALEHVLGQSAFDLERILAIEPDFLGEDAHEHDSTVASVSFTADRPIDAAAFQRWISGVLQTHGPDIFRAKGILQVAGGDRRLVFQAVHMLMDMSWGIAWRAGEARASRLVFIGRGLDAAALRTGFEACLADAAPSKAQKAARH